MKIEPGDRFIYNQIGRTDCWHFLILGLISDKYSYDYVLVLVTTPQRNSVLDHLEIRSFLRPEMIKVN